jgi:predicted DNA-binding protein YlxM (UPF0122 family)
MYAGHLKTSLNSVEQELKLATTAVSDCNDKREAEIFNCSKAISMYKDIDIMKEDTNNEVKEKIKTRKFTIISAKVNESNNSECGCKFDGVGWVFK